MTRPNSWIFDSDGHYTVTISEPIPRTYLVHLPLAYSPDALHPLILSFHGHSSNPDEQEERTGLSLPGLTINGVGLVAVYPQGVIGLEELGKEGTSSWQGAPYAQPDVDDVCAEDSDGHEALLRSLLPRLGSLNRSSKICKPIFQ